MKCKRILFVGAATLASITGAVAPQPAEASFLTSSSNGTLVQTDGGMGCGQFGHVVLYHSSFGGRPAQYRVHTVIKGVGYPTAWTTAGPAAQWNFAVGRTAAKGVTYSTYFEYREWDVIYQRWLPARGEYVLRTHNGVNTYYCKA